MMVLLGGHNGHIVVRLFIYVYYEICAIEMPSVVFQNSHTRNIALILENTWLYYIISGAD